jgi:Spy/CpxP family protein refolding chaperone
MLSRKNIGAGLLFLMVPVGLSAQSVPADSSALMKSEGAGMARYADVNGYPGPKHVLELQEELGLSEDQVKQIEAIFDEMAEKARIKGEEIITAENALNDLFETQAASEQSVRWLSTEIGRLRGELRAVHLLAHLQAKAVLTPGQTTRYGSLRHGMEHHKH